MNPASGKPSANTVVRSAVFILNAVERLENYVEGAKR
jgi:hypothetical protein